MKPSLNIHYGLLAKTKLLAARRYLTLTRMIQEGSRIGLGVTDLELASRSRAMPVFNGKTGLTPGLGSLSTREMLDTADYPQDKSLLVLLPAA